MLNPPYDVLIASQTPLTASTLSNDIGNGFYQGIFLTTGNLAYDAGGGNWQSTLTADQWQTRRHDIGLRMASRMAYNKAAVSARLELGSTPSQIQVSAANSAANVPVTGVSVGNAERYGGQTISTITVDVGATVTVPGPAC